MSLVLPLLKYANFWTINLTVNLTLSRIWVTDIDGDMNPSWNLVNTGGSWSCNQKMKWNNCFTIILLSLYSIAEIKKPLPTDFKELRSFLCTKCQRNRRYVWVLLPSCPVLCLMLCNQGKLLRQNECHVIF